MSSLTSFFPEQFEQLKAFMISGVEVVRCVRIDNDMKDMLLKALAKMEDDDNFQHAFLHCTESFNNPEQYFDKLYATISEQYLQHAVELKKQGVKFDEPLKKNTQQKTPFKFLSYAEILTENFPDHVGSLVFILEPEEINDIPNFQRSIKFLTENTKAKWLKFLLLDQRVQPSIEIPEQKDNRIGFQTFHLSPEEIQQRIKEDLASPRALQSSERRQYIGMQAGFAFSNKNYVEAEKLQRQWLESAEKEGEPSEVATVLYNLGNTLIEKGEFSAATDTYCRSCEICIEHKVIGLTPMVYTNLGVSLHRQGNFPQAFAALKVARDTFKAQNYIPGEAYVVEMLAQMYADDNQNDKAEQSWRYALTLYDNITSSLFNDLREMGHSNVQDKLKRFFEATGQTEKMDSLKMEGENGSG